MPAFKHFVAGALTLAAIATQPVSAATMIDDFSLPVPAAVIQILNDPNPQTIVTNLGGGTTRTAIFTVLSTPVLFSSLNGGIGGGVLAAGFNPVSFGTVDVNYVFAAPVDLSAENFFLIESAAGVGPVVTADVVLQTAAGNLTRTFILPAGGGFVGNYLDFSGFAGLGDRSQTNGVQIRFNGSASSSLLIDSVQTTTQTPEPGTALTMLLAVPALAALRRRAKA